MRKRTSQTLNNIIVVSDTHVNSRVALLHPDGCILDGGTRVVPTVLQTKLWSWWLDFWNEWVPLVTRGEPYGIVINGDLVDGGAHHNNTQFISNNPTDQKRMALQVLEPLVPKCEGRLWVVRGTEVHGGQSGCFEEEIAQSLGAVKDEAGLSSRWELWLRVGKALCHFSHHIGTSSSLAYETSAVQKELEQAFVEAARYSQEKPLCLCRSHRHRNIETRIQTDQGFATSFVTAGWQLKTPFAHKVAGGRQSMPQIGGSLIRYGDEDLYTRHYIRNFSRPRTEEPVVG